MNVVRLITVTTRSMIGSSHGKLLVLYYCISCQHFFSNGSAEEIEDQQWGTLESPGGIPTISPTPPSLLVNHGSVVYLPCEVSGIPTAEVTWKRGELELVKNGSLRYIQRDGGLVIIAANDEDDARFTCTAQNSFGFASKATKVTVTQSEFYMIENKIYLTSEFSKSCSWYRNDVPIAENDIISVQEKEETRELKIQSDWQNEGKYTCKNESGSVEQELLVTMSRKPNVNILSEKEISIKEGVSMSIPCNVTGIPPPLVTWSFNGQPKQPMQKNVAVKLDNTLIIRNADMSLEGVYTCTGKNYAGENNKTISIKIIQGPVINDGPSHYEVVSGGSIQIPCKVDTKPTPKIRWHFFNKSAPNNYKVDLDGTLTISNADSRNSGQLRCQAKNAVGEAMKNFTLNVITSDLPAEKIQATNNNDALTILTQPVELHFTFLQIFATVGTLVILIGVMFIAWYIAVRRRGQNPRKTGNGDIELKGSSAMLLDKTSQPSTSTYDRDLPNNLNLNPMNLRERNPYTGHKATNAPPRFAESSLCSDAESEKVCMRERKYKHLLEKIPNNMIITIEQLSMGGPIIGKGHFGIVRLEKYYDMEVACKTINDNGVFDLFAEGTRVGRLNHPRILSLYGITFVDWCPILVTEYLEKGSLDKFINNKEMRADKFLKFSEQIVDGMKYLHSLPMIHRDLAARNCMLDASENVKIGDFGLSRECDEDNKYRVQTPERKFPVRWIALEAQISPKNFTLKCDVWAYGVVLWEMFNPKKEPYHEIEITDVYYHLKAGNRLKKPNGCPENVFNQLMMPCWNEDVNERPSFTQLAKRLKEIKIDPELKIIFLHFDDNSVAFTSQTA